MKHIALFTTFLITALGISSWTTPGPAALSSGTQPQVSVDSKGIIRIVFGRSDSIFCATSKDQGNSFSVPLFVAHVTGMHLGMSRGPQIAGSMHSSVITAMDKTGDIHFFQLNHTNGQWTRKGFVNDIRTSAPEGLMGIAADNEDNFYAAWLDTRQGKKNNIFFASLGGRQSQWSKNKLAYQSPDSHVCECCKPNVAVNNKTVAIMFRNWIDGSRDLYVTKSVNQGKDFEPAQKMGNGTWKLNGCPMDGGGLGFDHKGEIQTTWQRQGVIYTCQPGKEEIALANGRGSSLARDVKKDQWIISFQDGENAKLFNTRDKKELMTVKGSFLKTLVLNNGKVLCVWELDKKIMIRTI